MREREPLRELAGGGVRRLAIERHHRRWHAWHAAQLRAPVIAHWRDLDVVRTSANGFVKTMHSHVSWRPSRNRGFMPHANRLAGGGPGGFRRERGVHVEQGTMGRKRDEFYARGSFDQAKEIAKAASTVPLAPLPARSTPNIFFAGGFSTGFARGIHRFSTCRPGSASGRGWRSPDRRGTMDRPFVGALRDGDA